MRGIGKDLQAAFNLGYKARDIEIVRCKDCRWYYIDDYGYQRCENDGVSRKNDWFCADGEKRDDGDNH